MSRYVICPPARHIMQISRNTFYPETISVFRRDKCNEDDIVGGGTELSTNGSHGLELLAAGRYAPDEKETFQAMIESFVSDVQTVIADGRNYGPMIMLEGSLTEKPGEVGGTFRLRLGGYEL